MQTKQKSTQSPLVNFPISYNPIPVPFSPMLVKTGSSQPHQDQTDRLGKILRVEINISLGKKWLSDYETAFFRNQVYYSVEVVVWKVD